MLALRYNGTVVAWGKGTDGQLGDGANSEPQLTGQRSAAGWRPWSRSLPAVSIAAWPSSPMGRCGRGGQRQRPAAGRGTSPAINTPGAVLDAGAARRGRADRHCRRRRRCQPQPGDVRGQRRSRLQLGRRRQRPARQRRHQHRQDARPTRLPGLSGVTGIFAWSTADVELPASFQRDRSGRFARVRRQRERRSSASGPAQRRRPPRRRHSRVAGLSESIGAKVRPATNFKKPGPSRSDVFWRQDTSASPRPGITSRTAATNFTAAFPAGVPIRPGRPKATADVNGDGISDVIWFRPSDRAGRRSGLWAARDVGHPGGDVPGERSARARRGQSRRLVTSTATVVRTSSGAMGRPANCWSGTCAPRESSTNR